MILHATGTIHTPSSGMEPASTVRGVVVEVAPYSACVAYTLDGTERRAWFVADGGSHHGRLHGTAKEFAPVWQADALDAAGIVSVEGAGCGQSVEEALGES